VFAINEHKGSEICNITKSAFEKYTPLKYILPVLFYYVHYVLSMCCISGMNTFQG